MMHSNQNKPEYVLHGWSAFQYSNADPLAVVPTNGRLHLWRHLYLLLLLQLLLRLLLHSLLLLLQRGLLQSLVFLSLQLLPVSPR